MEVYRINSAKSEFAQTACTRQESGTPLFTSEVAHDSIDNRYGLKGILLTPEEAIISVSPDFIIP